MDGSSSPNKFFSKALLPPVGVGSLLIIFFVTGFSKFFISFSIVFDALSNSLFEAL